MFCLPKIYLNSPNNPSSSIFPSYPSNWTALNNPIPAVLRELSSKGSSTTFFGVYVVSRGVELFEGEIETNGEGEGDG